MLYSSIEQNLVMIDHYNKILEFNKAFEVKCVDKSVSSNPAFINSNLFKFRMDLINEEANELREALNEGDIIEVIDALVDILYVTHGAMVAFGFQPESKYLLRTNSNKTNMESLDNSLFLIRHFGYKITDKVCKFLEQPNKNMEYIVQWLDNLLLNVYRMLWVMDIDADKAFDIVHKSNMSKLCDTEQQAIATVDWYKDVANGNTKKYDSPTYRPTSDNTSTKYIIYNKSTGKVLKNMYYIAADFSTLFY